MSLDVSLTIDRHIGEKGTGIFVREDGRNRELTVGEIMDRFPDADIVSHGLVKESVFEANITHDLGNMAKEAGIYYACWRPEEIGAKYAKDILPILKNGYDDLKARPEHYKQFDSPNGCGKYVDFLPWVKDYLNACRVYPESEIHVSR